MEIIKVDTVERVVSVTTSTNPREVIITVQPFQPRVINVESSHVVVGIPGEKGEKGDKGEKGEKGEKGDGAEFPEGGVEGNILEYDAVDGAKWSGRLTDAETAISTNTTNITTNTTAIANEAVKRIQIGSAATPQSTSITTNTVGVVTGKGQHGRHVQIFNGVNAINIECRTDSESDFMASYEHLGSADITFTEGSGATVTDVYGGAKILKANGTCAVTRNGNTFKLFIP